MAKKAWIITADMGYGHQRAAYPLQKIMHKRIITANTDDMVTPKDKRTWGRLRFWYEFLSRMRSFPVIGHYLWKMYDNFQSISPFYPFRDMSKPNFGSLYMHKLIRKGFLKSIVEHTREEKIPFLSSFFLPALAAAHWDREEVYAIVTDTDINRVWVPEDPQNEKIYYLAPSERVVRRLERYGVPSDRIFFTGFPLPDENTGKDLSILKKDIGARLCNLDPDHRFMTRHVEVKEFVVRHFKVVCADHPLTLMYAVGGAGAQKDIGGKIIHSLRQKIRNHDIRLVLVAGTRPEIKEYFENEVRDAGLTGELGTFVIILFESSKDTYFKAFNQQLRTTDILWTKPSELSFYAALGIPIIKAPPLGYHEHFNSEWLDKMHAGIDQKDPQYCDEWLFDYLREGRFAEMAWEGFIEAPKFGTANIEKVVFSKDKKNLKFSY